MTRTLRSLFDLDHWQEVFETLRRHRLRTLLTALSVAWGIFMLVLLLGAGSGLEHGAAYTFRDDAVNSIWIFGGETSLPYQGLPVGRKTSFTNGDYDALKETVAGIDHITGRFYFFGEFTVNYKDKHASFDVRACHPDHRFLENTIVTAGRFLNDKDVADRRKVAVIGEPVAAFLFGKGDAIGREITINGLQYVVVGVFADQGGEGELRKIYIPISTAQLAYNAADRVHQLMFTVGDASPERSRVMQAQAARLLAARHDYDPADPSAIHVRNNLERYGQITRIFTWISLFVWIVGLGTVVAGIVAVSNIMLISVRERTREFGVRKALGATPGSIVSLVLQESILLTAVSGYCGLVLGVGALELVAGSLPASDFFRDPQVSLGAALGATVLLVGFGALAGFFPARRAARINPIEALRDE